MKFTEIIWNERRYAIVTVGLDEVFATEVPAWVREKVEAKE